MADTNRPENALRLTTLGQRPGLHGEQVVAAEPTVLRDALAEAVRQAERGFELGAQTLERFISRARASRERQHASDFAYSGRGSGLAARRTCGRGGIVFGRFALRA